MEECVRTTDRSELDCQEPSDPGQASVATEPSPPTGSAKRTRAHLAPWQAKLAREMMVSQIQTGLGLADIADRLHMSVNHFIKAFRETEGTSPYHWYMRRRIAEAKTLLRDDSLTLSKVADACGFADQSHFTKAFTRFLGISPGRWRRDQLKDAAGDR